MKRILIVLLTAFLTAGCMYDTEGKWITINDSDLVQNDFPISYGICPGFTTAEQDMIQDAVEWWNDQTGDDVFYRVDDCESARLKFRSKIGAHPSTGFAAETYHTFVTRDVNVIFWAKWQESMDNYWNRQAEVRHEIGHFMGLGHDYPANCLMYYVAEYTQESQFCMEEVRELCKRYSFTNCKLLDKE